MVDPSPKWHSVHVYYYEERKDDLILDCVRPLFRDLSAAIERGFFVRHWMRGPHLRLRFCSSDDTFSGVVKTAVEERVGRYLVDHPSTAQVSEEEMLATHEKLAEQEQESGPLFPLYPDNSIRHEPYDRRLHVLRSEEAAGLLEDFYVETNELAFEMLEHIRAGNSRLGLSLDLMLAVAEAVGGGITRGFLSYRSHSEAFIMNSPDPPALRSSCEERYRARSVALSERLRQVLETLDGGRDGVPFVLEWVAIVRRFWSRAEPLIASGSIHLATAAEKEERSWDPEVLRHSRFHHQIQSSDAYRAAMRTNLRFRCYRLMLNYLYLHMNRLGVKPVERFVLCYLAANAVEERFGVSATELVST